MGMFPTFFQSPSSIGVSFKINEDNWLELQNVYDLILRSAVMAEWQLRFFLELVYLRRNWRYRMPYFLDTQVLRWLVLCHRVSL